MKYKTIEQLINDGATLLDVIGEAEIYEIGNNKYIFHQNEIYSYYFDDSKIRGWNK